MRSLYKLITITNLKSPIIAFPLAMPLIFTLLYTVMVSMSPTPEARQIFVNSTLVTTLSITTMQSGLQGFGLNFMNLKKSVLLRRIGVTRLTKVEVLGAVILYGMTIWLISFLWIIALSAIFSAANMYWGDNPQDIYRIQFAQFNWGRIILSTLIGVYLSFAMGAMFVSISKNINMFQGLVMVYFFSASILGGLLFPGIKPEWMNIVSFIIPHAYFADIFAWSADAGGTFSDLNFNLRLSLDIVVPILIGTGSLFVAVKFLKFS